MRKLIGSIALTLLAASIAGCAEEQAPQNQPIDKDNPFAQLEQAAVTAIAGSTTGTTATDVVIDLAQDDIAIIAKRAIDGVLTINGYAVMDAVTVPGTPAAVLAAGVKTITIGGTNAKQEQVILDFSNGFFAKGSAVTTDGIFIDLKDSDATADNDTIGLKLGSGSDVVSVTAKKIKLDSDAFEDVQITNKAPVKMYLGAGNDSVATAASTLIMALYGGDGNDTFTQTDKSTELISGGAGTDVVTYAARAAAVTATMTTVALLGTGDDGESAEVDDLADDIETIVLGAGDDVFTCGTPSCNVTGGAGNDTLNGGAGNDTLNGGTGNDTVNGLAGADIIDGGDGNDTIDGGVADDKLTGGLGDDTLLGNDGKDTLTCGAGNDTTDGGLGDDDIKGEAGNDTLAGGAGNDKLDGGVGDDTFDEGGASNGGDALTGGDGIDTLTYAGRANPVIVTLGAGTTNDGESNEKDDAKVDIENVIGGAGDDTLTGSDVANEIVGGAGVDTLAGGKGDDTIEGGLGLDVIDCGEGIDVYLDVTLAAGNPINCEFP